MAAMDGTPAQMDQMLGTGPRCIAVIHAPDPTEKPAYVVSATHHLQLSDRDWQPLPPAARLDIDVLYAKPDNSQHPLFACYGETNATLAALTMDCDPASAAFSTARRTITGGVAFQYADEGKQMAKAVLEPLKVFIDERITSIKQAFSGPESLSAASAEYATMNPKAFKLFWKNWYTDHYDSAAIRRFGKVECPVTLIETSCEACGKDGLTREQGGSLRRCPCMSVLYCDRDCQKKDRNYHKHFCSAT